MINLKEVYDYLKEIYIIWRAADVKALNYGSLNIDFVYNVEHFVRCGETISSQNMAIYAGGKGLNQSVAKAKRGIDTWQAGNIDEDGEILAEILPFREGRIRTAFNKS